MNVIACYKIVPNDQDIVVKDDGNLDLSKAERVIGEYDLVAIEEAARIAEATGGRAVLLSAGSDELKDSKLIKAALSRGAEELYCVVDSALADADSFQIASVLAQALQKMEFGSSLVICGEGSSDLYAQLVGTLLGSLAGIPVLNAVSKIEVQGDNLVVERTLEREVEILELTLPAVISVTTDINLPRIPKLKEILAAGKKPVTTWNLSDLAELPASNIEVFETLAPKSIERKQIIYQDASDESIGKLAFDIKMTQ